MFQSNFIISDDPEFGFHSLNSVNTAAKWRAEGDCLVTRSAADPAIYKRKYH